MQHFDKTIEILERLIAFPTISTESNEDCINWIAEYLGALGARVELTSDTPGKANIFATLGPEGDGGIILSGHSDVVPVEGQDWNTDPFTLVRQDDHYFGRGTCDMKGFIAAALAMAPDYAAMDLKKPVHFAFTYDEKTGCLGAAVLVDKLRQSGIKPSVAIIGEPTLMQIIEGHKGCCEYTCEFTGIEGHSSRPEQGVNALEYATMYIQRLMTIREDLPARAPKDSRYEPPHSTVSITGLQSGIAHNVIPNRAEVKWEMRVVDPSDQTYVRDAIASYVSDVLLPEMQDGDPSCNIEETYVAEVDALVVDPDNKGVELIRELTGINSTNVVAFGTEAGLFQTLGLSSVICGPGSIDLAHKPNEFVTGAQLKECLGLLDRLKEKLL